MVRDKGFWVVFAVFVVLLIADIVSTLRLGDLVPLLEANPIYKHVGLIGIVGINVVLLSFLCWVYLRSTKPLSRFSALYVLVFVCFVRVFVVLNNWLAGNNPPTLEEARMISSAAKQAYAIRMVVPHLLPYVMGWLAWFAFSVDHDIRIKEVGEVE